jgi:hypothetical protein
MSNPTHHFMISPTTATIHRMNWTDGNDIWAKDHWQAICSVCGWEGPVRSPKTLQVGGTGMCAALRAAYRDRDNHHCG